MRYYFQLQLRRTLRFFELNGMNPIIGVVLTIATFFVTTLYLIHQFEHGEWYVGAIALAFSYQVHSVKHHDFLATIFDNRTISQIRVIESFCVSIPLIVILVSYGFWEVSIAAFFASILIPFIPLKRKSNMVLPTPFRRIPYEFPTGFRKAILAFPLALTPVLIGFQVDNPNLMIGAMLIVTISIMSFGYQPEPVEYVWMHKRSPGEFIWYKLHSTFIGSQVILIPFTVLLISLTSFNWLLLLLIHAIATVFILALRLAKYAAYPNEIGVAQALLLGLCFWFPPLLIVVLPKFFHDGKQRLRSLLT